MCWMSQSTQCLGSVVPLAMFVCKHVLLEFWFSTRCHLPNLIIILYPRWWTLPKICRYIGTWEPAFKALSGPWLVVWLQQECKFSWCFSDRSWWLNLHFMKALLNFQIWHFKVKKWTCWSKKDEETEKRDAAAITISSKVIQRIKIGSLLVHWQHA